MDFAEFFVGEVGVDLRRRDVRVAQEFLHGTEIRTVHQEVGRKLVTKLVRIHFFRDAGFDRPMRDEALDRARDDATDDFRAVSF